MSTTLTGYVVSVARRAGCICRVVASLHRPAELALMERTNNPRRFAELAMTASGRHLALAAAFLPEEQRLEGTVAFLLCRALDGCEDLSASCEDAICGLRQIVKYLEGADQPLLRFSLAPHSESDCIERLLLSKLALLRELLRVLPGSSRARVLRLVCRMAIAMESALQERALGKIPKFDCYCDGVLGEAVTYAYELLTGQSPLGRGRTAAGRLLHIANDLRDLEHDHRNRKNPSTGSVDQVRNELTLRALKEVPYIPQLLVSASFPPRCAARGALAIIVSTTTRFYLRNFGVHIPDRVLHPVWTGLRCSFSGKAFERVVAEADAGIFQVVTSERRPNQPRAGKEIPENSWRSRRTCAQQLHEYRLALCHPSREAAEALAATVCLVHFSMDILHFLPQIQLREDVDARHVGLKLVTGDLFAISAAECLSKLGNDAVEQFADMMVALVLCCAKTEAEGDSLGETAAFLSRMISQGTGVDLQSAREAEEEHRRISQQLYVRDRQSAWNRWTVGLTGRVVRVSSVLPARYRRSKSRLQ